MPSRRREPKDGEPQFSNPDEAACSAEIEGEDVYGRRCAFRCELSAWHVKFAHRCNFNKRLGAAIRWPGQGSLVGVVERDRPPFLKARRGEHES